MTERSPVRQLLDAAEAGGPPARFEAEVTLTVEGRSTSERTEVEVSEDEAISVVPTGALKGAELQFAPGQAEFHYNPQAGALLVTAGTAGGAARRVEIAPVA